MRCRKHLIVESNGVAASCSTHSDLTKLFLDDTQPFSYENTSSQEGQKVFVVFFHSTFVNTLNK